eukprot:comp19855_c1_seq1/m.23968 comp19855_c1_seq1/g.23968  ORF comp19855_c1_seq1/g.23968 comp19855_c1_seq1/m.23968 type:complete len:551 (-) comp19855_c1_seq1:107-1759(-)
MLSSGGRRMANSETADVHCHTPEAIRHVLQLDKRGKIQKAAPQVVSELGTPVPEVPHAVSVCMPKWRDNVDYEEGERRVHDKLFGGYPRFCFHPHVVEFFADCRQRFAREGEACVAFPSLATAEQCVAFMHTQRERAGGEPLTITVHDYHAFDIRVVTFPQEAAPLAKSFWQHSGELVSSRMAQAALRLHREMTAEEESLEFIEQHYGRHLATQHAEGAKHLVRERIADLYNEDVDDVYVFPCGMSAIYNAHRILLKAHPERKSVMFGFPYLDTLKILQKFGPGCHFLGHGNESAIAELESILEKEKILAVFCEFPSNPLLKSPDLRRLSEIGRKHGFPLVVDDTIGSYCTLVNEIADITATSLTKIFSGDSNVMGGSLVLARKGAFYEQLKKQMDEEYEDNWWYEDAVVMERNSRDVIKRSQTIAKNTERLCEALVAHPKIGQLHYPEYVDREKYDAFMRPGGGYGCLFSIVLKDEARAPDFFDALEVSKGPSLGTNFTLSCPYTILAHYTELDFAATYGISRYLVRVSVGMENVKDLIAVFNAALEQA